MNSIKDIEKSIIEEFEMFDNWTQKYEYLIDISKELPKMENNYKTDAVSYTHLTLPTRLMV